MPTFSKKDSHSQTSQPLVKGLFLIAALAAFSVSASAQSSASSFANMDYSFALGPNDGGREGDVTVSDSTQTYNLIIPFGDPGFDAPYTSFTGTGSASASVGSGVYYDSSAWAGNTGVSSSANSGVAGTATASVGYQQNLFISNTSLSDISFTISALARISGTASITGAHSGSNFANVDTYVGIYDFDVTNGTAVSNPLLHISGNDLGTSLHIDGDWAPVTIGGVDYYQETYTMTIAAGGSHLLEFYTSSKDVVSSAAAVPAPPGMVAMLCGLTGLARRRKKRA